MSVYKEAEFNAFLKLVKRGQAQHWAQIAVVLGVDKNTITAWKKLPEAKKALAEGISKSLESMETAGKNDWRMWAAKLRMLGVETEPSISVEYPGNAVQTILKGYGLLEDEE